MAARQEIHKIGMELIGRYSMIRMRLTAVGRKATVLQQLIKKGSDDAATTRIACRKISGTQRVFEVIQKSEKGVDPVFIRQVTGLREQKIAKILYKLFKSGDIKVESGGLYLAAAIR